VNDSFFMRSFQCIGDLSGVVEGSLNGERRFERCPRHQFHHQRAILNAVDLRNIGMVQRRKNFGFAFKPRQALRVLRECIGQNLDRYTAFQLVVACAIHLAHAARTDGGNDFVRSQTGPSGKGHEY
jgi:hypothetical protein